MSANGPSVKNLIKKYNDLANNNNPNNNNPNKPKSKVDQKTKSEPKRDPADNAADFKAKQEEAERALKAQKQKELNESLYEAVYSCDKKMFSELVSRGADVTTCRDEFGMSFIGMVLSQINTNSACVEFIQFLLDNGYAKTSDKIYNNTIIQGGPTALFFAIFCEKLDVVKLLIEKKYSEVNERYDGSGLSPAESDLGFRGIFQKGDTPLILAARIAHEEIVNFLLSRPEIDIHARNIHGADALIYACLGNEQSIRCGSPLAIVRSLFAAGAYYNRSYYPTVWSSVFNFNAIQDRIPQHLHNDFTALQLLDFLRENKYEESVWGNYADRDFIHGLFTQIDQLFNKASQPQVVGAYDVKIPEGCLNARNKSGDTALHVAVNHNQYSVVNEILRQARYGNLDMSTRKVEDSNLQNNTQGKMVYELKGDTTSHALVYMGRIIIISNLLKEHYYFKMDSKGDNKENKEVSKGDNKETKDDKEDSKDSYEVQYKPLTPEQVTTMEQEFSVLVIQTDAFLDKIHQMEKDNPNTDRFTLRGYMPTDDEPPLLDQIKRNLASVLSYDYYIDQNNSKNNIQTCVITPNSRFFNPVMAYKLYSRNFLGHYEKIHASEVRFRLLAGRHVTLEESKDLTEELSPIAIFPNDPEPEQSRSHRIEEMLKLLAVLHKDRDERFTKMDASEYGSFLRGLTMDDIFGGMNTQKYKDEFSNLSNDMGKNYLVLCGVMKQMHTHSEQQQRELDVLRAQTQDQKREIEMLRAQLSANNKGSANNQASTPQESTPNACNLNVSTLMQFNNHNVQINNQQLNATSQTNQPAMNLVVNRAADSRVQPGKKP